METSNSSVQEGVCRFYVKSIYDSYQGQPLLTQKREPYIRVVCKVTDDNGNSEIVKRTLVVAWESEVKRFLRCINRLDLLDDIKDGSIDWIELEDEEGKCRIKKDGDKSVIESFVKPIKKEPEEPKVEEKPSTRAPSELKESIHGESKPLDDDVPF